MKLLLVLGSDETSSLVSSYAEPLGFNLIRYRYVPKAMDNLEEIDPAGIIISARDFPRHWKVMVQYVRSSRPKEICPIILLKDDHFPLEETSKAFFLGVSGIVSEALEERTELDRLQGILSRYIPLDEKRKAQRHYAENWNRFGFLFSNPKDMTIISGEVKTISSSGLSFAPLNPDMLKNIRLNMELRECSLRAGSAILSPVCVLTRTGLVISLRFESFPENEQGILDKYLEGLPFLKLKNTLEEEKKKTEEKAFGLAEHDERAEELSPLD
ncbi:MAG: PilZ domain-containing protein [Treponema sp.]|jgi:hypothetical protein|nr:PilZ domain-containing protein [Treponema sp.]